MMTTEQIEGLAAPDGEACYLIRKNGAWYRKNSKGYTTSAIQAGRYTLKDADAITHPNGYHGPRDGMFYVHVSGVRDDDFAEVLRLTATVADLTAANIELVTECARLKGRDEALRAIADLTDISGVEFKRKHPELNKLLDKAGCENWGEALSEFAARAYLAGGA